MNKPPPPSLFATIPWSFAACGLLISIGNLLGLAATEVPLVPATDNLPGLMASSLFLFGCGLFAQLVGPYFRKRNRS